VEKAKITAVKMAFFALNFKDISPAISQAMHKMQK